ncbi:MAG: cupin-like domain-containing protein [Planctomycetaceae bacterium]|nr:cupin-like domain-containing protein [Planctomycetaceae bacterium]
MQYLQGWTKPEFDVLEEAVLVAKHRLHETGMFTDDALAELIDRHPDDYLTIAAMGNDENKFEWMTGKRDGASGKEMIQALRTGKIWVNLICLARYHPEYAKILNSLYDELEKNAPRFQAKYRSANLLISSPNAIVYYHIDLPVNMLWHIRGEKRVWVYPHFDNRFASQRNIERAILGEMSEDMPYQKWFEDYALEFHVKPGQMMTWPQHSPHRVTNLDTMCVSLSTEHRNQRAKRRVNVHLANHYLKKHFGLKDLSIRPQGWNACAKEAYARAVQVVNKLLTAKKMEPYSYRKRFVVDPNAELGYRMLDGEDATDFKQEEAILANV